MKLAPITSIYDSIDEAALKTSTLMFQNYFTSFNNSSKKIKLKDLRPPKIPNEFLKLYPGKVQYCGIGVFDPTNVKIDNYLIRAKGTNPTTMKGIALDYTQFDWRLDEELVMYAYIKPLDQWIVLWGRHRVGAAKIKQVKEMPCHILVIDCAKPSTIKNLAQFENYVKPPQENAEKIQDAVVSIVGSYVDCLEGRDDVLAINDEGFVDYDEIVRFGMTQCWGTLATDPGTFTKICKKAFSRIKYSEKLVEVLEDHKQWERTIEECSNKRYQFDKWSDNSMNKIVYTHKRVCHQTDQAYRPDQAWGRFCVSAIEQGDKTIEIVLFSREEDPIKARRNIENYADQLNRIFDCSNLSSRPYKLFVAPQFRGTMEVERAIGKPIPIEDFVNGTKYKI